MSMKLTCGEFVGLAYANDDELREFAEEILAENAKLRELVRDMWQEHECCHLAWPATIADRMRELGVDDG